MYTVEYCTGFDEVVAPLLYCGNERKSEQAHITHAPTLLENAVYNGNFKH